MPKISSFPEYSKSYRRPSWHRYFLDITELVAKRSTCRRRQVGAILVKDNRILATGYNGAPSGLKHCLDVGCLREEMGIPSGERQELCRGLHAEQNVIIQAAFHGVSIAGSTLFCTCLPCITCSKMLIQAGIRQIYYLEGYPDEPSLNMLESARIKVIQADKKPKILAKK